MKSSAFAAPILSLAFVAAVSAAVSATPSEKTSQPTPAQLKQMAKDARTPEQYAALAQSYGQLQKSYLEKAAEEKQECDRRGQNVVSIAAKYTRPLNSARNLFEYYSYKATEAGDLAAKYRQLAASTAAHAACLHIQGRDDLELIRHTVDEELAGFDLAILPTLRCNLRTFYDQKRCGEFRVTSLEN